MFVLSVESFDAGEENEHRVHEGEQALQRFLVPWCSTYDGVEGVIAEVDDRRDGCFGIEKGRIVQEL